MDIFITGTVHRRIRDLNFQHRSFQHSGNDPRRMSLRQKLCFVLEPSLEIEETHPKDQHPHMCQDEDA